MLFATVFCITSCESPGEGKKAESGKTLGKQVVVALESFKKERGHYPEKLTDLYPLYIASPLKEAGQANAEGVSFYYGPQEDGTYMLSFRYFGPGINNCRLSFASKAEKWDCDGYY